MLYFTTFLSKRKLKAQEILRNHGKIPYKHKSEKYILFVKKKNRLKYSKLRKISTCLYYACLDSFRPLSFAFVSGTMITLR